MKQPNKATCLTMAEYQFKCRNDKLMWCWLFEWASHEDDMQCHVDREILKQRKTVMTKEQMERFKETFPEFDNVLGRTVVAWVEAEVMEQLAEQLDQVLVEDSK
jgi:hypothetical protein